MVAPCFAFVDDCAVTFQLEAMITVCVHETSNPAASSLSRAVLPARPTTSGTRTDTGAAEDWTAAGVAGACDGASVETSAGAVALLPAASTELPAMAAVVETPLIGAPSTAMTSPT